MALGIDRARVGTQRYKSLLFPALGYFLSLLLQPPKAPWWPATQKEPGDSVGPTRVGLVPSETGNSARFPPVTRIWLSASRGGEVETWGFSHTVFSASSHPTNGLTLTLRSPCHLVDIKGITVTEAEQPTGQGLQKKKEVQNQNFL